MWLLWFKWQSIETYSSCHVIWASRWRRELPRPAERPTSVSDDSKHGRSACWTESRSWWTNTTQTQPLDWANTNNRDYSQFWRHCLTNTSRQEHKSSLTEKRQWASEAELVEPVSNQKQRHEIKANSHSERLFPFGRVRVVAFLRLFGLAVHTHLHIRTRAEPVLLVILELGRDHCEQEKQMVKTTWHVHAGFR